MGQGNLLATIVPKDNELVTRFYVTSEVIKNITTGDEIRVKIEAYPPEKFGTLSARVYEVSGTDISSEKLNLSNDYNAGLYILKVEFTDTFQALHSRGITLEPGMNVSGTIVEENFKFWQLILGPILDS